MADCKRLWLRRTPGLLLVLLWIPPGCGGASTSADPEVIAKQELEDIGEAYQLYLKQKKRAPSGPADLRSYEPGFASLSTALRGGQYVVQWKANPSLTPDAAETVLAYQKAVPQQGGLVLMVDGKVRHLSAEAFKAATLARER